MKALSLSHIRSARLADSGLLKPFSTPEKAARALFGVQAQIHSAGAISLFNRTSGMTLAEIESKLFDKRSLIKLWGQRGTLHFYETRDWALLSSAYGARFSWTKRYYIKCGGTAGEYDRTVRLVTKELEKRGTVTRDEVRHLLTGNPHLQSSWGGIFFDLVRSGLACHAKSDGPQGVFASRRHWLGDAKWELIKEEEAQVEIARRYFKAYGPATVQDFAYWRGVPLSRAKHYTGMIKRELQEIDTELGPMLICNGAKMESELPGPRLLYRFDPVLLGHKDKGWIVPVEFRKRVIRPAGHMEGIAVEDGAARATWRYDREGKGLRFTIIPFGKQPKASFSRFRDCAERIAGFMGMSVADFKVSPR